MAETPATRSSLQRTPPPSLPYKLEIDQLKRRLALVAGGTDAAELTALLAKRLVEHNDSTAASLLYERRTASSRTRPDTKRTGSGTMSVFGTLSTNNPCLLSNAAPSKNNPCT